ncbi:hypothetical protein SMICM17S_06536 [Streptomyces microflavus]
MTAGQRAALDADLAKIERKIASLRTVTEKPRRGLIVALRRPAPPRPQVNLAKKTRWTPIFLSP